MSCWNHANPTYFYNRRYSLQHCSYRLLSRLLSCWLLIVYWCDYWRIIFMSSRVLNFLIRSCGGGIVSFWNWVREQQQFLAGFKFFVVIINLNNKLQLSLCWIPNSIIVLLSTISWVGLTSSDVSPSVCCKLIIFLFLPIIL